MESNDENCTTIRQIDDEIIVQAEGGVPKKGIELPSEAQATPSPETTPQSEAEAEAETKPEAEIKYSMSPGLSKIELTPDSPQNKIDEFKRELVFIRGHLGEDYLVLIKSEVEGQTSEIIIAIENQ